jgi:hypothetical protein
VKILEAAARKTILGVLLLLLKEVRRLTKAIEIGVDSFRIVHGQQPQFTIAKDDPTVPEAERTIPRYESDEPDWLKVDLIEALCREHHIAITDGLDLFKVAADMGWTDSEGRFVTLPSGYGD